MSGPSVSRQVQPLDYVYGGPMSWPLRLRLLALRVFRLGVGFAFGLTLGLAVAWGRVRWGVVGLMLPAMAAGIGLYLEVVFSIIAACAEALHRVRRRRAGS